MAGTAPWRQMLLDSLDANKHLKHSKYFQLATVRKNGGPAVRTVVFRGFEEGTDKMLVTTDSRSRKVEELKVLPQGEMLVYLTDTWEQFRLRGHVHLIGPESPSEEQSTRRTLWNSSPPKSLLQFVGPHPGLPVSNEGSGPSEVDKDGGPVDNFLILTVDPAEVDYLHLKENKRLYFEKNGGLPWTEVALNP